MVEALADLFDSLDAAVPGQSSLPGWMRQAGNYLSSHPATAQRSEAIRAVAELAGSERPSR